MRSLLTVFETFRSSQKDYSHGLKSNPSPIVWDFCQVSLQSVTCLLRFQCVASECILSNCKAATSCIPRHFFWIQYYRFYQSVRAVCVRLSFTSVCRVSLFNVITQGWGVLVMVFYSQAFLFVRQCCIVTQKYASTHTHIWLSGHFLLFIFVQTAVLHRIYSTFS